MSILDCTAPRRGHKPGSRSERECPWHGRATNFKASVPGARYVEMYPPPSGTRTLPERLHPLCPEWDDHGMATWEGEEDAIVHDRNWVTHVDGQEVCLTRSLLPVLRDNGRWDVADRVFLIIDGSVIDDGIYGPSMPPRGSNALKFLGKGEAESWAKVQASSNDQVRLRPEWVQRVSLMILGISPKNSDAIGEVEQYGLAELTPDDPRVALALAMYPNS